MRRLRRSCSLAALAALGAWAVLAGCENDRGRELPDAAPPPPPSPWRVESESGEAGRGARIAVSEDADEDLEAAIAEARATAEGARERWERTAESLRTRWAVKWAAETADGKTEYLWVQPVHWSPFRIEGVLASDPVNELASAGRDRSFALGDLVSFPIDELADWVHYLNGDTAPGSPREGGFTIDVLEARYGRPRP